MSGGRMGDDEGELDQDTQKALRLSALDARQAVVEKKRAEQAAKMRAAGLRVFKEPASRIGSSASSPVSAPRAPIAFNALIAPHAHAPIDPIARKDLNAPSAPAPSAPPQSPPASRAPADVSYSRSPSSSRLPSASEPLTNKTFPDLPADLRLTKLEQIMYTRCQAGTMKLSSIFMQLAGVGAVSLLRYVIENMRGAVDEMHRENPGLLHTCLVTAMLDYSAPEVAVCLSPLLLDLKVVSLEEIFSLTMIGDKAAVIDYFRVNKLEAVINMHLTDRNLILGWLAESAEKNCNPLIDSFTLLIERVVGTLEKVEHVEQVVPPNSYEAGISTPFDPDCLLVRVERVVPISLFPPLATSIASSTKEAARDAICHAVDLSSEDKQVLMDYLDGFAVPPSHFLVKNIDPSSPEKDYALLTHILLNPGYEKLVSDVFRSLEAKPCVDAIDHIAMTLGILESTGKPVFFKTDFDRLQQQLAARSAYRM